MDTQSDKPSAAARADSAEARHRAERAAIIRRGAKVIDMMKKEHEREKEKLRKEHEATLREQEAAFRARLEASMQAAGRTSTVGTGEAPQSGSGDATFEPFELAEDASSPGSKGAARGAAQATAQPPEAALAADIRVVGHTVMPVPLLRYTLYTIRVHAGPRLWRVHKRFSSLREFHAELLKIRGDSVLPRLPPSPYFGNLGERFLRGRRLAIESYLRQLASMQDLHVHHSLLAFVSFSDVPSAYVAAVQEREAAETAGEESGAEETKATEMLRPGQDDGVRSCGGGVGFLVGAGEGSGGSFVGWIADWWRAMFFGRS
jgi:hypothetical protein